jgi:hypothetical protein
MSRLLLILPVIFTFFVTANVHERYFLSDASTCNRFLSFPCDTIPELNQKILELVDMQIGKTVGNGECWDLAALVLNQNGTKWDGAYKFGRKVNPKKECIYPGDIIQFEGVKIRYVKGRTVFTETMAHHTAIIREVKGKGIFILAHQNTAFSGRKVGLSVIDLSTIISGKYQVFRPVM